MKVRFGQCLLQEILNRKGMTQIELSIATGISKTQISDYINNRVRMSLKNAKIISLALNCSIDDLYEWDILLK